MSELSYSALMPPMVLVAAIPLGAVLALRWRRLGLAIVLPASILLYALCTPLLSMRLLVALESSVAPASPAALARAQAIAVLGGDVYHGAPPSVPDDVGLLTLDRLRLGAALYRRRKLPIVVSGGAQGGSALSLGALMAQALERDFGVPTSWIDGRAENTFENAARIAEILKAHDIHTVLVVTEAWHMPRAIWSFEQTELDPVPAPAERSYLGSGLDWSALLPDYASYERSFDALHEMLGMVYYRWHYGAAKAPD